MNALKWFKKEPAITYQVEQVEKPVEVAVAFDAKGLRSGSWVMTPDGVGVLTAVGVELAKEDGTKKMVVIEDKAVPHVVTEVYRQAYLEEIPQSRAGIAYSLGYESNA